VRPPETATGTRPRILPDEEEAAALLVRPGSITWERSSDARVFAGAVYTLLLQVAHPTVGAGVAAQSTFRDDPWGRLLRTLDYAMTMTYGGDEAVAMGRRIREMHGLIRGTKPDGSRYSALEPEAFAWVHLTLAEGIVRSHELLGRPFTPDEREELWAQWRGIGRLLGIRDRDLPATWVAAEDHRDAMIRERLVHTEAVDQVLPLVSAPTAPADWIPGPLWGAVSRPAAYGALIATGGLLGPVLREELGVPWSPRRERLFGALCRVSRASGVLLPAPLRITGPGYLRLRRRATRRAAVTRVALELDDRG
jgi:uncharacterized protein (DUF2236 family)